MAICVAPDVDGFIRKTVDSLDTCTSMILMDSAQYHLAIEPVLNSADIAYVFGWGFAGVVIIGYFGGYLIGIAKSLIRKILGKILCKEN